MNVTVVNKSKWSDESLQAIVDFLAPCYGHVGVPVRLTFKTKHTGASSGWAADGTGGGRWWSGGMNPVVWSVTVLISDVPRSKQPRRQQYPFTRTYKRRAGGYLATNLVDEVVHTTAHELRHVEQFEALRLFRLEHKEHRDSRLSFGAAFRIWAKGRAGFPCNSCEVDAEKVAHGLLAAYKTHIENRMKERAA